MDRDREIPETEADREGETGQVANHSLCLTWPSHLHPVNGGVAGAQFLPPLPGERSSSAHFVMPPRAFPKSVTVECTRVSQIMFRKASVTVTYMIKGHNSMVSHGHFLMQSSGGGNKTNTNA